MCRMCRSFGVLLKYNFNFKSSWSIYCNALKHFEKTMTGLASFQSHFEQPESTKKTWLVDGGGTTVFLEPFRETNESNEASFF